MSNVLITGSNGTIGTVLSAGLPHEVTPFDLPEHDARDYESLVEAAKGKDAIIHLAWDTVTDNYRSDALNIHNYEMAYNVYRAAIAAKVGRVVMASSVNADRFTDRVIPDLLRPYDSPIPNSPYGAEKVGIEALGRYYASKHLGVVCLRFGDLNPDSKPAEPGPDLVRAVWLSHEDCVSLVDASITEPLPNDYAIINGVSNNDGRIHDTSNPLGWVPRDGAR